MDETASSLAEVSIPERFLKREQERILALEKRQEERESKEGEGFGKTFNDEYKKIKTAIAELDENGDRVNKDDIKERIAEINKQIVSLNHVILDGKIFLPLYDMKMYNSKLVKLTEECDALEAKLLPRKKFGFRKTEKVKQEKIESTVVKDSVDFVKSISKPCEKDIGFYDRNNETLELASEEICRKPVSLSNLESCVVKVNGNASTVHMNNINKSKIYLGPVSNSVFIENCSDSTLQLACHQLRMHTSKNCRVYLHSGSRPIIEHCTCIGFAPHVKIDKELFHLSGLKDTKNHWNEVDDFNWLSLEEKSPNWFIIKETDREN